jgi:ATP-dependent RNA helicase DeaD
MSATFPEDVRALADRVQTDPAHVEGTRLGAANADIVHHIILVDAREKLGAVINILLASPDEQALVFARTRADVASLARHLAAARFDVGSLSGEMDQTARNRAMAAFKKGTLRVMVATDVAARGIDVQNVAHVIHADPPGDADTYTHRSGRTGRAGRKGRSSVLVTPSALRGVSYLLRRAGVAFVVEPAPSAESIRAAADERLFATLTGDAEEEIPERTAALAGRLAATGDVPRVLARLLQRVRDREASEPVELRRIEPPVERPRAPPSRPSRPADAGAPRQGRGELPRAPTHGYPLPRPRRDAEGAPDAAPRQRLRDDGREWARFRVTWGSDKGADPRRLLAVICRRGGIRGSDVGAIRIGERWSTVEVDARVARAFSDAAGAPDPREPGVVIRPDGPSSRDHERPPRPPVRPAAESPPRRPPPRTGNGPRAREPHYKGARSRPAMDTREPPKRHR